MNDTVILKWAPGVEDRLTKDIPDNIVHEVATATLSLVTPTIPERTGKMKRSTTAGGVRGGNGEYYIGSYTDYAKYVYVMDNNKTHWTTPGTNLILITGQSLDHIPAAAIILLRLLLCKNLIHDMPQAF